MANSPLTVIFSEHVESDLFAAYLYYQKISPDLGKKFIQDFENRIAYISQYPLAFQLRYGKYRAAFFDKFPYKIIYKVTAVSIIATAVLHNHHGPNKLLKV
jgi:plasmid stabilization system protein ParE